MRWQKHVAKKLDKVPEEINEMETGNLPKKDLKVIIVKNDQKNQGDVENGHLGTEDGGWIGRLGLMYVHCPV